jgi:hypothetical protein
LYNRRHTHLRTHTYTHRLLSLGALTRGDRRAATVMDFSSFALDNKEGGTVSRACLCADVHAYYEWC